MWTNLFVSEKIGHIAQSYFLLKDLLQGNDVSPLVLNAQYTSEGNSNYDCS